MESSAWQDLLSGRQPALRLVAGHVTTADARPRWVFPGSFNPRHEGHDRMAAWVCQRHGQVVEFELSIDNVEKPSLSAAEVGRRLSAFGPEHPVWVTRAATFVEKAQLFPQATFLVGADTLMRIADPAYYRNGETGVQAAIEQFQRADCRFLVFGRLLRDRFQTLTQLALPTPLVPLCQAVSEVTFRADISSTQLRGDTASGTGAPPVV